MTHRVNDTSDEYRPRPRRALPSRAAAMVAGLAAVVLIGARVVPAAGSAPVPVPVPGQPGARHAGAAASGKATSIASCTYAALVKAMKGGGMIVFACDGTITVSTALVVKAGQDVTLDASGHSVSLSGDKKARIFQVTGGSLTLVDLSLDNGASNGSKGPTGTKGTTGAAGAAGRPARTARVGRPTGRMAETASRAAKGATEATGARGNSDTLAHPGRAAPSSSLRADRLSSPAVRSTTTRPQVAQAEQEAVAALAAAREAAAGGEWAATAPPT